MKAKQTMPSNQGTIPSLCGQQPVGNCGRDSASDGGRFAAWLFVAVFASRAFTSSSAFFADANRHVTAARNHTYVIEPPGYWLFNRTAGLFPDPEIAISVMNWCFSSAAAAVVYLAVRRLASEGVARISSVAYATVFWAWHSGNVHSTYASQLLFPVAIFLSFLYYSEKPDLIWVLAAAVLFALGAGFRPSDGAFFAPAFLYGLSKSKRGHLMTALVVVCLLCVCWLVPQQLGLVKQTVPIERNFTSHFASMADGVLVVGFSRFALSNAIRVLIPLVFGIFPLLDLILRNGKQAFLWIWILPGLAFFLLIYLGEASYLDYLLAALVILASTSPRVTDRKKLWRFAVCAALNVAFYFVWRPIQFRNHMLQVAEYVIEADAGKFSYYGIQHHYEPTLSQLLHVQGYRERVPR